MEELEITLKEKGLISRLTNKTFNFDKRIGEGYYSANYFLKSQQIAAHQNPNHIVTEQWFQRTDGAMVCGIDESIAILQEFTQHPEELVIEALNDGDIVQANEPVLKVKGKYEDFGYLESLIDGILSRRSCVATNSYEVIKALRGTRVFSMADRQDDYLTQAGDGYASYVAGIRAFSTDAQGAWVGIKGMGTMPHALIALYDGDLNAAGDAFLAEFGGPITALIDYNNNVTVDGPALAKHLGRNLKAVRVDTSKSLIDHYFDDKDTSGFDPHGVCKELIFALRKAFDEQGYNYVQIIVSSSFNPKKIEEWTRLKVPVDMYGVGTYLVSNSIVGFTGDLVNLDGHPQSKEGRGESFSSRLQQVKLHKK